MVTIAGSATVYICAYNVVFTPPTANVRVSLVTNWSAACQPRPSNGLPYEVDSIVSAGKMPVAWSSGPPSVASLYPGAAVI